MQVSASTPTPRHLNITEATFVELRSLAKSSEKVIMICEPGLDYFKSKAPREAAAGRLPPAPAPGPGPEPACRVPQPGGLLGLPAHSEGGAGLRGRGDHATTSWPTSESPRSAWTWESTVSFSKTLLSLHHLHPIAKSLPLEYMVIETDSFPSLGERRTRWNRPNCCASRRRSPSCAA